MDIELNKNNFIHSIDVLCVPLDEKCQDGRGFTLNEKIPTAGIGKINKTDFFLYKII